MQIVDVIAGHCSRWSLCYLSGENACPNLTTL